MAILTHAIFHFNRLMVTLIAGTRASESPPGERLKRLGLIGLSEMKLFGGIKLYLLDQLSKFEPLALLYLEILRHKDAHLEKGTLY